MKQVIVRRATRPTLDYPFCVVVVDPDCKQLWPKFEYQEVSVRTIREGRIYANGICFAGGLVHQDRSWPVNPVLSPELAELEALEG